MKALTVREIAGEIWAEINMRQLRGLPPFDSQLEQWQLIGIYTDLTMGVLARHTNATIVNDLDMPVAPLPALEKS